MVREHRRQEVFADGALTVVRPIALGGDAIGTVFVVSDLTELSSRAVGFGRIIAFVLFATFWVALAVAFRIQRVISSPLLRLTAITRAVTLDRRYDLRAERGGDDEIGELVGGFNEMLDEIQ